MRWLHVSDLHFCPEQDGRSSRTLRETLPKYLQNHIGKVDAVFMTGDFRHAKYQKDDPEAAAKAAAFLFEIARSVGVNDPANIHIVPGNHDLTRDESLDGAKEILDITDKYSVEAGKFGGKEAFLWKRFGFFREVASLLHKDTLWPDDLKLLHPCRGFGEYGVVYMNTAISFGRMIQTDGKCEDDDRGKMVIGNNDLDLSLRDLAKENPHKPIIILAHHATELYSQPEREAVEEILKKYPVAAYLCGDSHKPWCRRINRVAEVTMGCMKSGQGVQAVFSVGELSLAGGVSVTAHEWRGHPDGWNEYHQFNSYFLSLFPPAVSGSPGPFGRDALIQDISTYLNSMTPKNRKTIEVHGGPGIGKTTVCREVMKKAAPAECFESMLRGMASKDMALDQILRSLGIPAKDGIPLDAQIEDYAKTRPNAVLYLDNAEDPLQDDAFKTWLLDSFPAKTAWRVIYSTRTSMKHTSVMPFPVPILEMPDAKAMFRSLFGSTTKEDEAALEGLLTGLSCHPLSIVLVTAQKDLYPSVQSLHAAWQSANDTAHDRFSFEDDPGPHASLHAAVQMSFEAIRENRAALVLWGMMSFLPADMPQAILELAYKDDPASSEAAVRILVKNCLLTVVTIGNGKTGYRMLNPLKDAAFAYDGQESVRDESVSRLQRAFLAVFKKANEFKAKDYYESHHFALDILPDTISFIKDILSKDAAVPQVLFELLKAMRNRFQYNITISLDLLEKMVTDTNEISAFLCLQKGDLERHLGKIDEAQVHLREAERLYRQERNDLGLANVLLRMGDLKKRLGKTDEAITHFQEAEGLCRQEQDKLGLANILDSIGDLERRLGKIDEAQEHYLEAEKLFRQEQDSLGLANVLLNMSDLKSQLGKIDEAQECCLEAEKLYRKDRFTPGLANVLLSMGDLESQTGKTGEAQAHYREAEELFRQERSSLGLANVLQSKGDLERNGGNWPQAIIHYLQAVSLYKKERNPIGQAYTYSELCRAYASIGESEKALHYSDQAKSLLQSLPPAVALYVADCIRETIKFIKRTAGKETKKRKPLSQKRGKTQATDTPT